MISIDRGCFSSLNLREKNKSDRRSSHTPFWGPLQRIKEKDSRYLSVLLISRQSPHWQSMILSLLPLPVPSWYAPYHFLPLFSASLRQSITLTDPSPLPLPTPKRDLQTALLPVTGGNLNFALPVSSRKTSNWPRRETLFNFFMTKTVPVFFYRKKSSRIRCNHTFVTFNSKDLLFWIFDHF